MNRLPKIKTRVVLGTLFVFGLLLFSSIDSFGQIESLEEVENILEQQDTPLKNIADRITNWILIGGAVVVLIISFNNKEHSRSAMIGYIAVIIFWLLIKALFF